MLLNVSATEFKNNFGQYLATSVKEPVVVEKSGKPASVLISYSEYQRFLDLEDEIWGQRALEAEKDGFLSVKESEKIIKKLLKVNG